MLGSQFASEKTASWLSQRLRAINICLNSAFVEEALTLLYSAIDTLSFLAAPADVQYGRGEDFIVWSDKYVVPLVPPVFRDGGVTGTDLYAARCDVLHTSSAASKKGDKGTAREIYYRFQGRTGVNLMANTPLPASLVDVEALVNAFEKGSQSFLADLAQEQAYLGPAAQRAEQFFTWGWLNTSAWRN
jgi:hypothetical protein